MDQAEVPAYAAVAGGQLDVPDGYGEFVYEGYERLDLFTSADS